MSRELPAPGQRAPSDDLQAGGLMLISVILYSSLSLAVALAHGSENPFFFTMAWRIGMLLGIGLYLATAFPDLFFNLDVWGVTRSQINNPDMRLTLLAYFDITLFVMSTVFISILAATILVQLTSVFFILFMHRLDKEGVYRPVTLTHGFLMLLGIVGFAFVIFAETGNTEFWAGVSALPSIIGGLIALTCAVVGALNARNFSLGKTLAAKHQACPCLEEGDGGRKREIGDLELFYVVQCAWIVNVVAVIANGVLGVATSDVFEFYRSMSGEMFIYSLVFGAVAFSAAGVLNRKANLLTSNLGINALNYARPLFAIVLLVLFAEVGADVTGVELSRVDYFVIGAAGIVSVNILISFEAERLVGFKALVLSLWICGMLVYLRDTVENVWTWRVAEAGYFEALALSATVFTLILSFRVARLASRTQDEDNRAFRLFREFSSLSRRGVVSARLCECVLVIDQSQGEELRAAYEEARKHILKGLETAKRRDVERLVALESDLDALAHSRQQDINFGELCALFIFCGITVGLALLSRPDATGAIGFIIEVFTVLFSSVIIFLTFNVLDLQRNRRGRILDRIGNPSADDGPNKFSGSALLQLRQYGVVFSDQGKRTIEQWVSVVAGLAVFVAYLCLLGNKWVGWFGPPWIVG